ncbi:Uncharacterised protein [Klebsiella pneumoniae]|nr:Uncharacterised protein [Klebsiella pneumoniae]
MPFAFVSLNNVLIPINDFFTIFFPFRVIECLYGLLYNVVNLFF